MIIELLSTLDIETRSLLSIHQQLKKEIKSTPVSLRDKPTISRLSKHRVLRRWLCGKFVFAFTFEEENFLLL